MISLCKDNSEQKRSNENENENGNKESNSCIISKDNLVSAETNNNTALESTRKRRKKVKDSYVQHDYHNYSKELLEDIPSNCISRYHMNHKGGNDILFPQKLHAMLGENSDREIFSWASHGRCFLIKKREEFVQKYLIPRFNINAYASFQRQLNRYNFKSITRYGSKDKGSYYHELFLRSRPMLSQLIRGQRNKGNGFKPLSSPQDEPIFCSFPPCYDIDKDLEATGSVLRCYDSPKISPLRTMTTLPPLQDIYQPQEINSCSPRTSSFSEMTAMPISQDISKQTAIDHVPSNSAYSEMTPIPIAQYRYQRTEIANTTNLLISNHTHGYYTAQVPYFPQRNQPLLVHSLMPAILYTWNIPIINNLASGRHNLNFSTSYYQTGVPTSSETL